MLTSLLLDNLEISTHAQAQACNISLELNNYLNNSQNKDLNLNSSFFKLTEISYIATIEGTTYKLIIPHCKIRYLLDYFQLDPNLVLIYAVRNNDLNIAKLAISAGADANYRYMESGYSPYSIAYFEEQDTIVNIFDEFKLKAKLTFQEYYALATKLNIEKASKIIAEHHQDFGDYSKVYQLMRSLGFTNRKSKAFIELNKLLLEYYNMTNGSSGSLNDIELSILRNEVFSYEHINSANQKISNQYGFNLLHLSIIAKNYILAKELITAGFKIDSMSKENIIPLDYLYNIDSLYNHDLQALYETIISYIENIDSEISPGETFADIFITNKKTQELIINKTQDSLFYLLKPGSNLFTPSQSQTKTHIAVAHEDDSWSTQIWKVARLAQKSYGNVIFHLINREILEKAGDNFLIQFDGIINPGALDSFPPLNEFNINDCPLNLSIEKLYKKTIEIAAHNKIPYLGICAGAQHLVLFQNGSLRPIKGYSVGKHQITFLKPSISYFMSLTKNQQNLALELCKLPNIKYLGDTAHNYVATNNNLGFEIQLGAISEDNIPMAYSSANGINHATQFHPEHYYKEDDNPQAFHQTAWIDNFIELAIMQHNHRFNNEIEPIDYFKKVKLRLEECLLMETLE